MLSIVIRVPSKTLSQAGMIALAELYADPDVDPRLRQQAHTLLKRGGCQQCAERELAELWLVDVKQRYDQPCPDSASVRNCWRA